MFHFLTDTRILATFATKYSKTFHWRNHGILLIKTKHDKSKIKLSYAL